MILYPTGGIVSRTIDSGVGLIKKTTDMEIKIQQFNPLNKV